MTSERDLRCENVKPYFTYFKSPYISKQKKKKKKAFICVFHDSPIRSKTEMLLTEMIGHIPSKLGHTWSDFVFVIISNMTDSRQNLGSFKYIVLQPHRRIILLSEVWLFVYAILSTNVV